MKNKQSTSEHKKTRIKNYFIRQIQAGGESLNRFIHVPIASILTIAVIGIALAMPVSLYALLHNIQNISRGFDDGAQISLFLKTSTSEKQAQELLHEIQNNIDVASASYVSPAQGLMSFENLPGFANAMAQLNNNPLPGVIVVHPSNRLQSPAQVANLLQRLQQLPQIDLAQLDMIWVKRLFAIINVGQHAVIALGTLFGLAVILIIGNTIRLSVQNHRNEIEIIKLVGATDGFIRRPFLYSGVMYGIMGALFAYLLTNLFLISLNSPIEKLANLYNSNFSLQGLDASAIIILFVLGAILGWLGSWLAVGRQLNKIRPE